MYFLLYLSKNSTLLLICAYRPPKHDVSYQSNLCNYIIAMTKKYPNAKIFCTGDFNLPDINWETESICGHRYPCIINDLALDMSAECGFTQLINFPTSQENILDLVFTTHPSFIQYCEPIPGISDHDMILTTINSNISYQKSNSHYIFTIGIKQIFKT